MLDDRDLVESPSCNRSTWVVPRFQVFERVPIVAPSSFTVEVPLVPMATVITTSCQAASPATVVLVSVDPARLFRIRSRLDLLIERVRMFFAAAVWTRRRSVLVAPWLSTRKWRSTVTDVAGFERVATAFAGVPVVVAWAAQVPLNATVC